MKPRIDSCLPDSQRRNQNSYFAMDIDIFNGLEYNKFPNGLDMENMLICSWNHPTRKNLMLVLVANHIALLKTTTLDLFAYDIDSNAPGLRIVLANGGGEIKASMLDRSPDLLEVIHRNNPEIGELVENHPSFQRDALDGMVRMASNSELPAFGPTVMPSKRL